MKKAYIINSHRYPAQLYRLVDRLNDGSSEFFIHIDKAADIALFRSLADFGKSVQFIERVDSRWGGFGNVQASLNGFKAIKAAGKTFDQIFFLSGQDYPIKSNAYINEFLRTSPHSVFIEYYPIPNYEKWPGSDRGGWYRVDKYYIGLKWYDFLRSKTMNFLSTYLPFLRRKIPNGMKPFTGSTWWSVDMYAMNYILEYDAAHPEYRAFHQYTFVPDELFLHMMVANCTDPEFLKRVENNNKRFILWEKSDSAHPNTLRVSDFEAIKASDHLFARKFDASVDGKILDLIDNEILYAKKPVTNEKAEGIFNG